MTRLHLLVISLLSVALAVALSVGTSAFGAHGGHEKVICKLKKLGKKRVVSCPRGAMRGPRGKRGRQGPAGPAGPAGAPGGAGSGLNLNFNDHLTANKAKELAIGNFTITAATNGAGKCEPIRLRAGTVSPASRLAIGAGAEFAGLASGNSADLTNGKNSNMFTAVSDNGASTMSGIVGAVTVGNVCLVSGYVTGV